MRRARDWGRGRAIVLLLVGCASLGVGCAQDQRQRVRARAGQGSATIAPDRRKFAPGETIPATGFGVDLVQSPSEHSDDGRATLTSFSRLGVPDAVRR